MMVAKDKPQAKASGPFPPTASGIEDGLRWEEVSIFGGTYRISEITTDEDDAAWDAAELPDDKYSNRILSRMQLVASIKSPKTGMDDLGRMSKVKVQALYYVHNRLNMLPAADAEGNA